MNLASTTRQGSTFAGNSSYPRGPQPLDIVHIRLHVTFLHFARPEEFSDTDFEDQLLNLIPLCLTSIWRAVRTQKMSAQSSRTRKRVFTATRRFHVHTAVFTSILGFSQFPRFFTYIRVFSRSCAHIFRYIFWFSRPYPVFTPTRCFHVNTIIFELIWPNGLWTHFSCPNGCPGKRDLMTKTVEDLKFRVLEYL